MSIENMVVSFINNVFAVANLRLVAGDLKNLYVSFWFSSVLKKQIKSHHVETVFTLDLTIESLWCWVQYLDDTKGIISHILKENVKI